MTKPPSPASPPERAGDRIAKLLARAGIASRREVERMIAEGRIKLNGELVTTPATVLESLKGVSVDGKAVRAAEAPRLFAFHKPAGLITAERDPTGRPTIYTALRNALPPGTPRVMPVGRLDLSTEGLLMLTNDGELKRAMELPSSGVPRTYRARTYGDISQEQLEELSEGITIGDIRYGSIDANMERRTGRNQWIELTLTEGKNREVRRVLEHLGLEVSRLLRTAYGPFRLGDLPRGAAVEIPQVQVERFRKALATPARGPFQPVDLPSLPPLQSSRREPEKAAPSAREPRGRPARTAAEAPKRAERPKRAVRSKRTEDTGELFSATDMRRARSNERKTSGAPRPSRDEPRGRAAPAKPSAERPARAPRNERTGPSDSRPTPPVKPDSGPRRPKGPRR